MFSIKRIAAASAVALAITAAGATAASAGTTPGVKANATPACSSNCFDLSSLLLGRGTIQNAYVPGDTGVGAKVGQKVNMDFASNSRPNMDFTGAQVGTLGAFCAKSGGNGLLPATSYACTTLIGHEITTGVYSNDNYPVFESNVAPFGNTTNLCVGAAQPVFSGENVTLRRCGTDASTIWIGDLANYVVHHGHLYIPWINGADSAFSHPLTLQVDPGSRRPVNQLKLASLNTLTNGTSPDAQEFTVDSGPVS